MNEKYCSHFMEFAPIPSVISLPSFPLPLQHLSLSDHGKHFHWILTVASRLCIRRNLQIYPESFYAHTDPQTVESKQVLKDISLGPRRARVEKVFL